MSQRRLNHPLRLMPSLELFFKDDSGSGRNIREVSNARALQEYVPFTIHENAGLEFEVQGDQFFRCGHCGRSSQIRRFRGRFLRVLKGSP